MKKVILILILLCFITPISIMNVESDTYENQYGKLEVYPNISTNIIRQKQFYNITWYYPDNDIDVAFRFDESLSYGGVYFFNGFNYNKVNHNYIEYNFKHYYVVSNIHFVQNVMKHGYWEYDVPINSSGKWDMFIKLSSDTWQYAFSNNRIVHLDPWWNSSWSYMKQLTINHSYVDSGLVNFPILVQSSDTSMLSKMDDGDSLRFTNVANDSEYNFEIEYFDDTDEMVVWVNITSVSSTVDTVFNMYYNNSGVSDGQDVSGTWSDDFIMVQHMNDITTSTISDSTSNANDGTKKEANEPNEISNGQIGKAQDFDGSDDKVDCGNIDLPIEGSNYFTLSFWIDVNTTTSPLAITGTHISSSYAVGWSCQVTTDFAGMFLGEAVVGTPWDVLYISDNNIYTQDVWVLVVITRSGDTFQFYRNGTAFGSSLTDSSAIGNGVANLLLGCSNNTRYMNASLDEFRISDVARNASWLKTCFHSQNQTTGFLVISGEYVEAVPCECIISNPNPINNSINIGICIKNLSVNVSSTCGSFDWVNISFLNYSNNVSTSLTNGTFYLNITDSCNLSYETEYTWFVNTSCNGTVNNTFFNFTTVRLIGCDCDEIRAMINEVKSLINDVKAGEIEMFNVEFWVIVFGLVMLISGAMKKDSIIGGFLCAGSAIIFILATTGNLINDALNPIIFIVIFFAVSITAYKAWMLYSSDVSED